MPHNYDTDIHPDNIYVGAIIWVIIFLALWAVFGLLTWAVDTHIRDVCHVAS